MLLEFQREFSAFLCGRAPPPTGVERAPGAAPRFEVYRRNVAGNLTGALAGAYPAIARALGEANFATLAGVFARAHPPREADLHRYGEGFAEALSGAMPEPGWLGDLARLDWAAHTALHAADAPTLDPVALIAAIDDGGRFALVAHPSLQLAALGHTVSALRTALLAQDDKAALVASLAVARAPEHLAVLRGATLALDPPAFRCARALANGAAFADAISCREDVAALQALIEGGCFCGLEVS